MEVHILQSHPRYGNFQGHAVYGIKTLGFYSPRLHTVVEDCASAATSSDARDKVFLSYVSESEPCNSKALRSELPALAVSACYDCVFVFISCEHICACSNVGVHGISSHQKRSTCFLVTFRCI